MRFLRLAAAAAAGLASCVAAQVSTIQGTAHRQSDIPRLDTDESRLFENKNIFPTATEASSLQARDAAQVTQAGIFITLSPAIPADDPDEGGGQTAPRGRQSLADLITRPADAARTITTAIVPAGTTSRAGAQNGASRYGQGGQHGNGDSESTEMNLAVRVGPGNILGLVGLVMGVLIL